MSIIHLRKGDALSIRLSATEIDGDPYPLPGWTCEAEMQFANCSPVAFGFEWVSQGTGVAKINLTAAQTAQLAHVGDYLMQARFISPEGEPISTSPVTIRVRD
jgi:hypothetical protein